LNALSVVEPVVRPQVRRGEDPHILVLGLGYVGLPTALALLDCGHQVTGLDISPDRLDRIREMDVDLIPSDLHRLDLALDEPDFVLTVDPRSMENADVIVICVPTPVDAYQVPDIRALRAACAEVVARCRPGQLIVLTSTTYPGTTDDLLVKPLAERGFDVGTTVNVVFSPERINPGVTTHEQHDVPRVVGGATPACAARGRRLLERIAKRVHVVSSPRAAELTKLYENTFRAVNISLANEFASACRVMGEDVTEILDAAETKPYGFMRFSPGPGVGGHCIPCDPHYLLWHLRASRTRMPVVESAMEAIERRPLEVVDRVKEVLADARIATRGARVLIVGVTYKANVADVRESPAVEITGRLLRAGVLVGLADSLVPAITLEDGTRVPCVPLTDVDLSAYDLVLVHTLHDSVDPHVLTQASLLIDASYRLAGLEGVAL
jgi:UDP-N-acetyl-D-glucosamine dehydrogenase